jgi:hypothetical protein
MKYESIMSAAAWNLFDFLPGFFPLFSCYIAYTKLAKFCAVLRKMNFQIVQCPTQKMCFPPKKVFTIQQPAAGGREAYSFARAVFCFPLSGLLNIALLGHVPPADACVPCAWFPFFAPQLPSNKDGWTTNSIAIPRNWEDEKVVRSFMGERRRAVSRHRF